MTNVPITPMSMESLRYWMRDQSDHALFAATDLSSDNVTRGKQAHEFSSRFQELEKAALDGEDKLESLVKRARPLVIDFVRFQNELLRDQLTGKLIYKGYPTFRDHLVRESQYFLRWIGGGPTDRTDTENILFETIFWLRQMVEHSLFVVHWADPYEVGLVNSSQAYADKFNILLGKARLFASMMSPQPVLEIPAPPGTDLGGMPPLAALKEPVPAIRQTVKQTLDLTREYRDYLIKYKPPEESYEELGIITSLFMDHQTRETQLFIADLENIHNGKEDAFDAEYVKMPFTKDRQEEMIYHLKPV